MPTKSVIIKFSNNNSASPFSVCLDSFCVVVISFL